MIVDVLGQVDGVEAHHEHLTTLVQPLSAKYFMGLASRGDAHRILSASHLSSIYWSSSQVWIDSSHKLTWLIEPLLDLFPQAKFVWIRRDGRKVTSSFFNKLAHEIYEDRATSIMMSWLDQQSLPEPPAEKRYWWNIPRGAQPFATEFPQMSQFQRCAYHWVSAHKEVRWQFENTVPPEQQFSCRLEDLVTAQDAQDEFIEFLGVGKMKELAEELGRPRHVIIPRNYSMTTDQETQFQGIALEEMTRSGYFFDRSPEHLIYEDDPARSSG